MSFLRGELFSSLPTNVMAHMVHYSNIDEAVRYHNEFDRINVIELARRYSLPKPPQSLPIKDQLIVLRNWSKMTSCEVIAIACDVDPDFIKLQELSLCRLVNVLVSARTPKLFMDAFEIALTRIPVDPDWMLPKLVYVNGARLGLADVIQARIPHEEGAEEVAARGDYVEALRMSDYYPVVNSIDDVMLDNYDNVDVSRFLLYTSLPVFRRCYMLVNQEWELHVPHNIDIIQYLEASDYNLTLPAETIADLIATKAITSNQAKHLLSRLQDEDDDDVLPYAATLALQDHELAASVLNIRNLEITDDDDLYPKVCMYRLMIGNMRDLLREQDMYSLWKYMRPKHTRRDVIVELFRYGRIPPDNLIIRLPDFTLDEVISMPRSRVLFRNAIAHDNLEVFKLLHMDYTWSVDDILASNALRILKYVASMRYTINELHRSPRSMQAVRILIDDFKVAPEKVLMLCTYEMYAGSRRDAALTNYGMIIDTLCDEYKVRFRTGYMACVIDIDLESFWT